MKSGSPDFVDFSESCFQVMGLQWIFELGFSFDFHFFAIVSRWLAQKAQWVWPFLFQVTSAIFAIDSHSFWLSMQSPWDEMPPIGWGQFDLPGLVETLFLAPFLMSWVGIAAGACNELPGIVYALKRHFMDRQHLYIWPNTDHVKLFLLLQFCSTCCNIGLLELADFDDEGYETVGGAQLLQGLCLVNYALLLGVFGLSVGRLREERSHVCPFPREICKLAGSRRRRSRKQRRICGWIPYFLLLNVCSAEVVASGSGRLRSRQLLQLARTQKVAGGLQN